VNTNIEYKNIKNNNGFLKHKSTKNEYN